MLLEAAIRRRVRCDHEEMDTVSINSEVASVV